MGFAECKSCGAPLNDGEMFRYGDRCGRCVAEEAELLEAESESPTGSGPPMPWWAKGSNYSPNE